VLFAFAVAIVEPSFYFVDVNEQPPAMQAYSIGGKYGWISSAGRQDDWTDWSCSASTGNISDSFFGSRCDVSKAEKDRGQAKLKYLNTSWVGLRSALSTQPNQICTSLAEL
jgi:hypothetical protein